MSFYPAVVRNLLTPLALWRRGERAQLGYQREFARTQYLSADELRDLQWRRMRGMIAHAFDRCPYYRRRFAEAGVRPEDLRGLDDVRRLPVLEKTDVQRYATDMIAAGWPTTDLIRNQTGGSTGTPIVFYLSKDRKCSRAAATLRHNEWAGWQVGDRSAVIWGAPRDRPADDLRTRVRSAVMREPLWLDTSAVTEQSLATFHRELHRHRPTVIQAYARSAVLFARYLAENRLDAYRPRSIVTSAEVLEPAERELLEEVFGCPVFNRYGCREFSVIASECSAHSGLHVMAEGLYVEIDTPAGPAAPGQPGAVLVTDLLNPAMPMIRYRIGDVASWSPRPCPCGRSLPMLEEVAGRVTDFLVGSDGRLVSGVYLATYVVAHRPSLGQVQIQQTRAGHVMYRLKPGPGFDAAADGESLRAGTREFLGAEATCEVEVVERMEASASGKFLFSTSTVAPGFLGREAARA